MIPHMKLHNVKLWLGNGCIVKGLELSWAGSSTKWATPSIKTDILNGGSTACLPKGLANGGFITLRCFHQFYLVPNLLKTH